LNWLTLLSLNSIFKNKCPDKKIDGVNGNIPKELNKNYLNGKFYEETLFNAILDEGKVECGRNMQPRPSTRYIN